METPKRAGDAPLSIDCEAGKNYAWCSCGHSSNQPLCDGTHKCTGMAPVIFTAEKDETKFFCTCKATGNRPFCDGTHKA